MKTSRPSVPASQWRRTLAVSTSLLAVSTAFTTIAAPLARVTFRNDAPFLSSSGNHEIVATGADSLFTAAGWADRDATIPANLYQWWWIFAVDSGTGNGALLDGNESLTLTFDKSVGGEMIKFLYTGGSGGVNKLARLSVAGFKSDPGATAVTAGAPRISNITYADGTVTFDYLNDEASDYGQLMLAHPEASAGATLKITGAVSPLGDSTDWYAALESLAVAEAYAGPRVAAAAISSNVTNTYGSADGGLVIRAYGDRTATTPANLGRYQDECFGVYGGPGGNVVDTNESLTLQFAGNVGLSRLDSLYSGNEVSIAGFTADPGLVDPANGTVGVAYADGTLTFTMVNGGLVPLYFSNPAASAGRTLMITVINVQGAQFGIAAVSYVKATTLTAASVAQNVANTQVTADGALTLSAFSDTPGTQPANLNRGVDWFGIYGGGNNESIEGTESLSLQFANGMGLSQLGTRYTSGQVVLSGFTNDPGFSDPSGIAENVTYADGTLSFTFNSPRAPEVVLNFTNATASAGQTLSLHTDGVSGSQVTPTRIGYVSTAVIAPVTLSLTQNANQLVLTWPNGTLQSSTNAAAYYSDVVGATSPYTTPIGSGQLYFRVKVQ